MTIRWEHLPDYRPPPLPRLRGPERGFVAANVAFSVGILCVALTASISGPTPASWTRAVVVPTWLVLLGTGWLLCDTLARSVHLLGGQWPTRARVLRGWAAPAVWVLVAELTVLSLEPTEVVDIRPAVAAVGFWFAAWRPFASMRRVFLSLTRLRHDTAIMAFGLLHIAVWSLLWWLLHTLPDNGTGVAWACVLASACACSFPVHLGRAYERAIAHRVLAIQTREEHKYVRSLGLNPFHAGTYLALVMAKQERERRRGASDPVDAVRSGHGLADGSSGAPRPSPWPWRRRDERSPGVGPPERAPEPSTNHEAGNENVDAPVGSDAGTHETTGRPDDDTTQQRGDERSGAEDSPPTGAPLTPPTNVPTLPGRPGDLRSRIQEAAASAAEAMRTEGDDSLPSAHDRHRADGDGAPGDARRPHDESRGADRDGEPPSPVVLPRAQRADDDLDPGELRPPRVASLESARYVALFGLIFAAVAYGWVAISALDLADPITAGRLSNRDTDRIQQSLDWATVAVTVMLPAQVVWVVMARTWIGRAGHTLALRRSLLLAATTACVAATALALRLFDGASVLAATLLALAGWTCWGCILSSEPISSWDDRGPLPTRLWATSTVVIATVHALVGFSGTVDPGRSTQIIAFVAVLLGLVAANTAIVVGVFALEVEDRIRSSAAVARWHRSRSSTDADEHDSLEKERA